MKLQSFLARAALVGVAATVASIVLGTLILEVFAASVATLVLLTVVAEYAPRPRLAVRALARRAERMPLAA